MAFKALRHLLLPSSPTSPPSSSPTPNQASVVFFLVLKSANFISALRPLQQILSLRGGSASRVYGPCSHTEPWHQKGPTVGLMFYCCHLKYFLIISIFNLCFISEIQWDSGAFGWAEKIHAIFPSLITTSFAYGICNVPGAKNSGGPTMCRSSLWLKVSTKWAYYVENWVRRGTDNSERPHLLLRTRTCFKHRKEAVLF